MKNKIFIFISLLLLSSCSTGKNISGNFYCICYFDYYPFSVIKIKNNRFELYSASIVGEKFIGKIFIYQKVLYLCRTHDLRNNFKDTIVDVDTSKYVIVGRKLIPFESEKCYYKRTNDKDKLFQLQYNSVDTIKR
jgi:hypothetical protein